MPEGPECYKIAKRIGDLLIDTQILNTVVTGGRYQTHGLSTYTKSFQKLLSTQNIKCKRTYTKGKLIIIEFDNGDVILSTLGLMGTWTTSYSKHCDLYIEFQGKIKARKLYFKDQIHYGTFEVIPYVLLDKKLKTLGPDVLTTDFTWEYFEQRVRKCENKTFPEFLMNQKNLSGIGNYLKAEILYSAKASLISPISHYTEEQLKRIFHACKNIPYICTHSTGVEKKSNIICVYNRKKDNFGNKVFKVKTKDGRTTHWVPAVMPIDVRTNLPACQTIEHNRNLLKENDF